MITNNAISVLFCKSEAPLSKLIIWGMDQPSSHVGIWAEENWVVHSDLMGLHRTLYADFMQAHTVVDTFKVIGPDKFLVTIANEFMSYVDADNGCSYDYGAFAYFSWCAALKKAFGRPIPQVGRNGSSEAFLCTEAVYLLNEAVVFATGHSLFPYATDLGVTSPWDLRNLLIKCAGGKHELDLSYIPSDGNHTA